MSENGCYKFRDSTEVYTHAEMLKRVSSQLMLETHLASGVVQRVPCLLRKDPSDMTEEEKADYRIWQPFLVPVEPITLEKMLLGLVLTKYVRSEEGRKQLAEVAKKYLDVVSRTMSALAAAGASHPLASLIHGRITISVYETLGLIQPEMARVLHSNFEDNINKIIAEKYLADVIGGIGEIIPG